MTLSDWTQYGDTGNITLDTKSYEGDRSLLFGVISNEAYVIRNGTDASEGMVEFFVYMDRDMEFGWGPIFRFQDANNYYKLATTHYQYGDFGLIRVKDGNKNIVDVASPTILQPDEWHHIRMSLIESDGQIVARYEEYTSGSWSQKGRDVVDSTAHFSSGGIGIGLDDVLGDYQDECWIDNTTIYI